MKHRGCGRGVKGAAGERAAFLVSFKGANDKAPCLVARGFGFNPGNDLISHKVALAVPSALRGLTSVFGMGTGVTLSVRSPETCESTG